MATQKGHSAPKFLVKCKRNYLISVVPQILWAHFLQTSYLFSTPNIIWTYVELYVHTGLVRPHHSNRPQYVHPVNMADQQLLWIAWVGHDHWCQKILHFPLPWIGSEQPQLRLHWIWCIAAPVIVSYTNKKTHTKNQFHCWCMYVFLTASRMFLIHVFQYATEWQQTTMCITVSYSLGNTVECDDIQ